MASERGNGLEKMSVLPLIIEKRKAYRDGGTAELNF